MAGNTALEAGSYNTVQKWFHWITVGLIAVALPVGFVIQHIKDADKMAFYAIHETTGLTILFVALARLGWRLTHPVPPQAADIPRPMRLAASTVHHLFYVALILQPVLGFLATNAFGFPLQGETAYFGLIDLPKFMETDEALGGVLSVAHSVVGWSLLGLLVLHIGGVVFHQAIRRDGTLLRMV